MFITFEGLDFSGKTTQVKLLKEYLEKAGHTVHLIREPGGTVISEKIRDILLLKEHEEMSQETELLLFAASRAQLVKEKILPALQRNEIVISDRFHDSTYAYQGFGRGINLELINMINNYAIGRAIPDITFFIDITLEEIARRKSRIPGLELDRIENSKSEFYEKVRAGFIKLSETQLRVMLINGQKEITDIHREILERIKELQIQEEK